MRNPGDQLTVFESGESEVLRRILARLTAATQATLGPGDDCAILRVSGDVVVTTDTMIEGPDFRLAWHSGFELGWKLAATNLSDVAAMGARPTGLTVAFACPGETPVMLLEEIARGLDAACRELAPGCGVIGGDLARGAVLMASVTALGDLGGVTPVLRSGAQAGDIVAYAGQLGLAGLGLSLLFSESADPDGTAHAAGLAGIRSRHPALLAAQLTPRPPIGSGVAAAEAGATAMLDVSDGLARDAARIAQASSVCIDLDPAELQAAFGCQEGEPVTLEAMLDGGEDHGLLATFPPDVTLPDGFRRIGTVRAPAATEEGSVPAGARSRLLLGGDPREIRGWDPFTVRLPGG